MDARRKDLLERGSSCRTRRHGWPRALTAAAVCYIVVAAVSMLKSLVNVLDVSRACRRHVKVIFPMLFAQNSPSETIQPKPLFEDALSET